MSRKITTISCGDWHLGWGIGHNKVGKLSVDNDGIFVWSGHSQGRHGQKSNFGARLVFTSDGETIEVISQEGSVPVLSVLLEGVNKLSNQ